MTNTTPTPDYAAARDYITRVLAHPDYHSAEAVTAAHVLQHLLPAPTLADMTFIERSETIGMWATINPGDDGRPWRGIIAAANRSAALVANPTALRMRQKPALIPSDTVTPDPTVPRAWTPNGTPAHPEPAPAHANDQPRDNTLAPGSIWAVGHDLDKALKQSPYTRAAVADRDNDLAAWADGYWDGGGFHPDTSPNEGPWRIIWIDTEPEEA